MTKAAAAGPWYADNLEMELHCGVLMRERIALVSVGSLWALIRREIGAHASVPIRLCAHCILIQFTTTPLPLSHISHCSTFHLFGFLFTSVGIRNHDC